MKKLTYFFLAVIYLATFSSCKKEELLPKATQSGEHTMAAKINGQAWISKSNWSSSAVSGISVYADPDNDYFEVMGQELTDKKDIDMALQLHTHTNVITLAEKSIDMSQKKSYARVSFYHNNKTYYTTSTSLGKVTITRIDKVNKILSGTFEFTAEESGHPENKIQVTEGRFDVRYQ